MKLEKHRIEDIRKQHESSKFQKVLRVGNNRRTPLFLYPFERQLRQAGEINPMMYREQETNM